MQMGSQGHVRVFAPATVANVGCGYDILGFALEKYGDTLTVSTRRDDQLVIKEILGAERLPFEPDENVATVSIKALLDDLGIRKGFDVSISKNMAAGSGLGSSASSSAAAVFAVNHLLGSPLETRDLVRFAMEGERAASGAAHADNVAPSLIGGMTIIRSYDPLDIISIPYPEQLLVSIFYPKVSIKTSDAKRILKQQIKLKDAVAQWGNVAGLVTGFITNDMSLISRSLEDHIIEPVRSMLIPYYDEVKSHCMSLGALGFNISGSGPSMFALSDSRELAKNLEVEISNIYQRHGIETFSFVSGISAIGARVV